jgi:hypothetical protein
LQVPPLDALANLSIADRLTRDVEAILKRAKRLP